MDMVIYHTSKIESKKISLKQKIPVGSKSWVKQMN